MNLRADLDTTQLLRKARLLADLPEAQLEKLGRTVGARRYRAGEVVFAKNSTGTSAYLVARGRIKLASIERDGSEQLFAMLEPGDLFGEFALADGRPRASDAVAERDSTILEIARRDLLPILESHPKSAMRFVQILCEHLRQAVSNLEIVGRNNASKRMWLRLMSLGQRYGRADPETGYFEIQHGFSQQNLADSIGMTRVMVNRQLGVWRDAGLIETGRGSVTIRDAKKLEALVWGPVRATDGRSSEKRR